MRELSKINFSTSCWRRGHTFYFKKSPKCKSSHTPPPLTQNFHLQDITKSRWPTSDTHTHSHKHARTHTSTHARIPSTLLFKWWSGAWSKGSGHIQWITIFLCTFQRAFYSKRKFPINSLHKGSWANDIKRPVDVCPPPPPRGRCLFHCPLNSVHVWSRENDKIINLHVNSFSYSFQFTVGLWRQGS